MTKSEYTKKTKKTKKSKYVSRTTNKLKLKKSKTQTHLQEKIQKQKTLRIIFRNSPGLDNDAQIYKNEFIKQGYIVEIKLIEDILHNHIEKYYDINLFLELLPFNCKKMFPAKKHLFMPNNELFIDSNNTIYNIHTKDSSNDNSNEKNEDYKGVFTYDRYDELKSIDFILSKTIICNSFFNFIKNENKNTRKYKYETIYTKFTSIINKDIANIFENNDTKYINNLIDPNLFVHLAGKSPFKNTPDLVHCWIKNKGFLNIDPDIKLVITCYQHCHKIFNSTLKKFYDNYDFEKDPDVKINYKTNIATYKNMTIYFKPIQPFKNYFDIMIKANLAFCISHKEGYGHYINEARYMQKFIITLDYPPMNELVIDKDDKSGSGGSGGNGGGNGIVLKKKNKFVKQIYKETKFNFNEAYSNSDELRDSIIWCIKHKNELKKWGVNGRKMFLDDKKYFEDRMEKFIRNKL